MAYNMDRKTFFKVFAVLLANTGITPAFAANLNVENNASLKISEGPYLLSMDGGKVCVVFMTNKRAVASVEVFSPDDKNFSQNKIFFDSSPTGRKHIGTLHAVWLENLAAGNTYSYKIEVKEVLEYWETYKGAKYGATKFGDILKCDTYPNGSNPLSFKTPSDKNPEMSFIVINDIHQTPKTVQQLLQPKNLSNADFILLNGDMVNTFQNEELIFNGFMRAVSDAAHGNIPIFYARGNHECRGKYSEAFLDYFPTKTGKPYYAFMRAGTFFLVLDMGEDKPDSSAECGGITDFDSYQKEESNWLEKIMASKEFKTAKRRIAISHIPPFELGESPYNRAIGNRFRKILDKANLNLMICAHWHERFVVKSGERFPKSKLDIKVKYPIIINGKKDALKVKIDDSSLSFAFINEKGGYTEWVDLNKLK